MGDSPDPNLLPAELAVAAPPFTDDQLEALYVAWDEAEADDGPIDLTAMLALTDRFPEQAYAVAVARWRIEDDDGAEWAGRRAAEAQAAVAVIADLAAGWVQRIEEWAATETRRDRRTVELMLLRLEDYGVRRRKAGGGATLTLPSVVVKTSDVQPRVAVADDEALAAELAALAGTRTPEQWNAWAEAMEASGLDERDLVKHTPKVYVQPLRQLCTIGARSAGYDVHATLACGHTTTTHVDRMDDLAVPSVAEVVECILCPADAIEGVARQAVAHVDLVEHLLPEVWGPDGLPVPGAEVEPGGIKPKVTLR